MLQQLDIPCGQSASAYLVSLIGKNLRDDFAKASEHPALKGKEGEARVKAVLARGTVSMVVRRKDNEFNDGPQGEPALLTFNANGRPHAVRHFKNGELQDSVKGELAVLQFDHPHGSKLVYAASFTDGKRVKRLTQQEMDVYPVRSRKSGPKAA